MGGLGLFGVSGSPVKYHYSHRFFTYSMRRKATLHGVTLLVLTAGALRCPAGSDSRTVSGGEFDWGGTSVKY